MNGQLLAEIDPNPRPTLLPGIDLLLPPPPPPRTKTLRRTVVKYGIGTGATKADAGYAAGEEALNKAFGDAMADAVLAGYEVVDLEVEFEDYEEQVLDSGDEGAPNRWFVGLCGTIIVRLTIVCEEEKEDEPLFPELPPEFLDPLDLILRAWQLY